MEILTFIGMVIAKANGVLIPWWCWAIWGVWCAVHLGIVWFWEGE